MDNYEEQSDSQINVYVHLIADPEWKDSDELDVPNYCGCASDAWPIITENGINIMCLPVSGSWYAEDSRDGQVSFVNTNPLRAAMIVFLKMQEAS